MITAIPQCLFCRNFRASDLSVIHRTVTRWPSFQYQEQPVTLSKLKRVMVASLSIAVIVVFIVGYDTYTRYESFLSRTENFPHELTTSECTLLVNCEPFVYLNSAPTIHLARLFRPDPYVDRATCEAVGKESIAKRIKEYGTSLLTRYDIDCTVHRLPIDLSVDQGTTRKGDL